MLLVCLFFANKNFNFNFFKLNTGSNSQNIDEKDIEVGSKGKITSATIIDTATGTGPWDADDESGNDSSEDNNIVRSFDQVVWTIDLTMGLKNEADSSLSGGIIEVEASLPENCTNVMSWDLDSMKWMESPKLSEDGRTVTGKYSMSDTEATVPGKQTLVFVLKVEGAGNGTEIVPTFKFNLAGNEENEKVSITDEKITVSATARYNIKLVRNTNLAKRVVGLNYDGQSIDGRVYGYAFVLQLYNDNQSKGLKGLEYPKGEITFDIDLLMQRSGFNSSELEDITDEANVLLWNYKVNFGSEIIENRSMDWGDGNKNARWFVPQGVLSGRHNSVYNSGNITMTQEGKKIKVVVNNYDFDGIFPQYNSERNSANSAIQYGNNIGCFSVGYFQLIVPDNESTMFDDRNYYLKVSDSNFEANSTTDINTTKQMITNDDSDTVTHVRYSPGTFSHHMFLYENKKDYTGGFLHSQYNTGDSVRARGQNFRTRAYVQINPNNDVDDYIRSIDRFIKYDGEAFEVANLSDTENIKAYGMNNMTFKYWYVTKKDGTNWTSQTEMNNGKIENMVLYEREEDIPEGDICIGIYVESQSGYVSVPATKDAYYFEIQLKIKDTAQINKTYGLTQTSKYWRVELDREIYTQTKLDSYTSYPKTAYNSGNPNYIKAEYDKEGNIVPGTHGGGYVYGQTVLIVGANLSGNIRSIKDGTEKVNYDVGKNENVATYSVEPRLQNYEGASSVKNVTLKAEVTIPKGLEYIAGSAKRNNVSYTEPEVTTNADGSSTLVWYIYNCVSGQTIAPILFDAQIDNESANGIQYTAKFVVSEVIGDDGISKIGTSKIDFRTSTEAINIINLASHRLYKEVETPIIEKNGEIEYKIVYENKTDDPVSNFQLLDVLPYNGDLRNTSYTGTYTLKNITIRQTTIGEEQSLDNLNLYTTNSETVREMDSKDDGIGTDSIWAEREIGANINEEVEGIALIALIYIAAVIYMNRRFTIRKDDKE